MDFGGQAQQLTLLELIYYCARVWLTSLVDNARFLDCLSADYLRIREVVPGRLAARVPSCPDWTVGDLVQHVGQVYLHKVECMREGAERETDWPPAGLRDEEPVALLDRAFAELVHELITRDPAEPGGTWYPPDPTVGFWFRRMAQESVIHRIDAELGAGVAVSPIPSDLAVDGTDELLRIFVGWAFSKWPEDFTAALENSPGRTYLIRCDATADSPQVSWVVRTAPGSLTVEGGPGEQPHGAVVPDVAVSGSPAAVLRWGWNREVPGRAGTGSAPGDEVTVTGDAGALAELRACVVEATQ
jgi:uncharacterized protein (TIGR03083 family)